MSTNNFCFKNRCVVVRDEDWRVENIPERIGILKDCSDFYPSQEIEYKGTEKLRITKIVLTMGYYADGCIDFIQNNEDEAENIIIDDYLYKTGKQLSEKITKQRVKKLLEKERILANKIIDRIKKDFGYVEVRKVGQFSNGEAVYERIK